MASSEIDNRLKCPESHPCDGVIPIQARSASEWFDRILDNVFIFASERFAVADR